MNASRTTRRASLLVAAALTALTMGTSACSTRDAVASPPEGQRQMNGPVAAALTDTAGQTSAPDTTSAAAPAPNPAAPAAVPTLAGPNSAPTTPSVTVTSWDSAGVVKAIMAMAPNAGNASSVDWYVQMTQPTLTAAAPAKLNAEQSICRAIGNTEQAEALLAHADSLGVDSAAVEQAEKNYRSETIGLANRLFVYLDTNGAKAKICGANGDSLGIYSVTDELFERMHDMQPIVRFAEITGNPQHHVTLTPERGRRYLGTALGIEVRADLAAGTTGTLLTKVGDPDGWLQKWHLTTQMMGLTDSQWALASTAPSSTS